MRRGQQEPQIRIEPARAYTDGPDASELIASYGFTLDPWQDMILDGALARNDDDQYASTSIGVSCPRQNGKNGFLEAREFYGLVINGEKILHTAHQVKTSKKAFNRLAAIFSDDDHPELKELVEIIRRTNGEECIRLTNGGSIEYSARSTGAARGWTVDTVVYDEASFLTDAQVEAIMSTLAAAPSGNRQLIYTGTPPTPTTPGDVFGRIRQAAIDGKNKSICWYEWGVQAASIDEIDVEDKDLWYQTNPALGIRLDEEFTAEEMATLSADGFARERLGWWQVDLANARKALVAEEWSACAVDKAPTDGVFTFAVKFSPDGMIGSIAGCVKPKMGNPYIEVVESWSTESGLSRFVNFLAARKDKAAQIVIDGLGQSQTLHERLLKAGIPKQAIIRPRVKDVIAAYSCLADAVHEQTVSHGNQPALNTSATQTEKRTIGKEADGGWGFQSVGEADASLIESCALALWSALNTHRDPSRKMRVL